jgi:hypothetical protein
MSGATSHVCVHPEEERESIKRSSIDHGGRKVLAEIEGLRTLNREQLNQRWRELFAAERPPRVCGELLIKALAYRLEEKALGRS